MFLAIFGPLSFPEPEKICLPFEFSPWEERHVECIFCKTQFFVPKECDAFSAHLRSVHRILVANLESVVSIKGYARVFCSRFFWVIFVVGTWISGGFGFHRLRLMRCVRGLDRTEIIIFYSRLRRMWRISVYVEGLLQNDWYVEFFFL